MKLNLELMFTSTGKFQAPNKYDIGYDLPGPAIDVIVEPGTIVLVKTGLKVKSPVFSGVRGWLLSLLFGMKVSGVGYIVKPRGRTDLLIGGGVIDVGYRGEILIKVMNTTRETIVLHNRVSFAQMIPVLALGLRTAPSTFESDTERGEAGGIWKDSQKQR